MRKSEVNSYELKDFWENYANVSRKQFLNYLIIYEIRQKFWKNFDNVKLNFMRIMKGLQKHELEKFRIPIFKKKCWKF